MLNNNYSQEELARLKIDSYFKGSYDLILWYFNYWNGVYND
jgi:hypothetical protein